MGQDVYQVPTIKNPSAFCKAFINLCHSWCTIWHGTNQYCWPTSSLPRIQLRTHLYQLLYASAGISYSDHWHHGRNGSSSRCRQLDRMIWLSFDTLNQQGRQFDSNLWNKLMRLLGSKCIRTIAYYPSFNGLVDRVHQQLKASRKAQTDPSRLFENLPMVILGIQTALNKDLHCTATKLVYATTLRLPGEFFSSTGISDTLNPASYVAKLKESMQELQALPTRTKPHQKLYISKDLATSTHVFVCHDAVRTPLQPPYNGPYHVLKHPNRITPWRLLIATRLCRWITSNQLLWSVNLKVTSTCLHQQQLQPDLASTIPYVLVDRCVDLYAFASRSLRSLGGSVVVLWKCNATSRPGVLIPQMVQNQCS